VVRASPGRPRAASAVLSWLVTFNVVNVRNPIVSQIGEFLFRVTEPAPGRPRAVATRPCHQGN
jgi:hypothetical protein